MFAVHHEQFYFHLHCRHVLFSGKLSVSEEHLGAYTHSYAMAKQYPAPARCGNCQTHAVRSCEEQNLCNSGGEVAVCEEGDHEDRLRRRSTCSRLPGVACKRNFGASAVKNLQFCCSVFPSTARPSSWLELIWIRLHTSPNLVLVIGLNFYHSDLWLARIPRSWRGTQRNEPEMMASL